jgi:hypothetical protein
MWTDNAIASTLPLIVLELVKPHPHRGIASYISSNSEDRRVSTSTMSIARSPIYLVLSSIDLGTRGDRQRRPLSAVRNLELELTFRKST